MDIGIIGSGAAALTCAIVLSLRFPPASGVKIHIFEKHAKLGGNSMLATSGLSIMNPIRGDTARSYLKDIRESGALVRVVCNRSHNILDLCKLIGVRLPHILKTGMHSVARTYTNKQLRRNIGSNLIKSMVRYLKVRQNVFIYTNYSVLTVEKNRAGKWDLLIEKTRDGERTIASTQILVCATGGYGYNRALVASCCSMCARAPTSNREVATGDGIKMLKKMGAQFVNRNSIQLHPTGFVTEDIVQKKEGISNRCWLCPEVLRASGSMLVNVNGARFVDELTSRAALSNAILKQPHKIAVLLISPEAAKLRIVDTYIKHKQIVRLKNEMPFAREIGAALKQYMPGAGAAAALVAYVTPCIHYTIGGIRVNTNFQVLNGRDKPIPRLYACGELAAVFKRERACGLGLVSAMVGGLVVAEKIAADAHK